MIIFDVVACTQAATRNPVDVFIVVDITFLSVGHVKYVLNCDLNSYHSLSSPSASQLTEPRYMRQLRLAQGNQNLRAIQTQLK